MWLFPVTGTHAANGNPTLEPFPAGMETITFGESAQACVNKQHGLLLVIGTLAFAHKEALTPCCTCVCFRCRYGMFLGSRTTLLAASRCVFHAGGLCRRFHTEPQLPRGLLRYGRLYICMPSPHACVFEVMARAHPVRIPSGLPGRPIAHPPRQISQGSRR